MHEYGITLQIIKMAENAAKEQDANRITDISIVVGELSGFIGDSIKLYFDIISKDTLAEGAVLNIKYIPPMRHCISCEIDFKKTKPSFECPICGSIGVPTDIGKEFYLESIEVES